MKQKKLSTNLTAAGVVVTVMAAALFFVVFPVYGRKIAVDYPEFSGAYIPVLIYLWVMSLPVWLAIWEYFRICREIGRDNSFSEENATFFNIMAALSGCASVLYLVKGSLYVGRCFAWGFERAGVMLLFIYGCTFAIFLICAFLCRSLSRLVHNAYEVKHENDLTI